jgi:hypothetical protein
MAKKSKGTLRTEDEWEEIAHAENRAARKSLVDYAVMPSVGNESKWDDWAKIKKAPK